MKEIIYEIINFPIKLIFFLKLAKFLRDDPEKVQILCDTWEKYFMPPMKSFDIEVTGGRKDRDIDI